jgi:branched-chain amino acid transport system permease protein
MIFWAVTGSIATRRFYLRRDLDTSNASFVGAMLGASTGPFGLVPLCMNTPNLTTRMMVVPALASVGVLMIAFGFADPENFCVSNGSFVASQIVNGLIIGIIYGFMALGLTLIFSILGVVSFAHGEFYMIGGMI